MLEELNELSELYYLKHRHDDNEDYYDYSKTLLDKSLSPYMYENNLMNGYLKRLQPAVSILLEHMNVIKNMKNYIVGKYYGKHTG